MRLTHLFLPTRKEDPADAEVISHKLLLRAGYIRMVARGIYSFLPLGWRTVRKIEHIVREEMDRAGAQEIHMPSVQPAELWHESGRWDAYGPELLRFKDRKQGDFVLGPTHEEVVTDLVRHDVSSYKQLPVNLYQIQTKFRDEIRPRFGLMRGREFIMKDAYSFDVTPEAARQSYQRMFDAYKRIFTRFGFEFRAVEADTGAIGGDLSHEFQVLAETGEDLIASCPVSGYAANVEKAELLIEDAERAADVTLLPVEAVETPNARTIEEVSALLSRSPKELVKTLIWLADGIPVAVCMRGDHAVNVVKLRAFLRAHTELSAHALELASDEVTSAVTKAPVGFAGPVGLTIPIIAELSVRGMANFVVGANKRDAHLVNVNWGRDFEPLGFTDLRLAQPGDLCARSGEPYEFVRGIEVGHIFYLGTKYSEALKAALQGEDGKLRPIEMGCYGIGITRILAAAVEQNHDASGIIWPMAIAPYHVIVLPLMLKDAAVVEAAEQIYAGLQEAGCEVLLDDRDLRAGAKFKDAELIGVPIHITIGSKGLGDGVVEVKHRVGGEVVRMAVGDVVAEVSAQVRAALQGGA